ncbi:SEC-C domain-containing protein, partial [candidate division KSB1 bacterium]|nr:SEC-C domain-containing protein [candidate division KSB1 bacterium]
MKIIDIGRNDPCPCGSGKKFKKCCIDQPEHLTDHVDIIQSIDLPPQSEIDYGPACIDDPFLDSQKVHEMSAQRLIYSILLMPELEKYVNDHLTKIITRAREERTRIKDTDQASELIEIMTRRPDPLNECLLIRKILKIQDQTIPLILKELKKPNHDTFFELAVKVIQATHKKYTDQIIDIIQNYQRDAYVVSILTLLLGFFNEKHKSDQLLWNLYHYF